MPPSTFVLVGYMTIAINHDRFDYLNTALRTAVDNDGILDKEATSYNYIFDAFRLAKLILRFRYLKLLLGIYKTYAFHRHGK